ncbi:MAG: hypothetical protein HQL88_10365 [Magnetococcales bacterium]|nr:hypothetical protein [Magnetococcales bacterium]
MGNAFALFSSVIATLWTWTLIGVSTWVGYQVSQEKNLDAIPGFDMLPAFLRIPLQHQTDNAIVFTLFGVLSGFLLFFVVGYVWQALQDFVRLALVKSSVERARQRGLFVRTTEDAHDERGEPMAWRWVYYPRMTRLWREYAETLHRQVSAFHPDETAQVHYRSTVSAETIFSTQALVDVPMRVEFFRHLPGILTGAGIVSTFAGILLGLSEFNPSVEAQQITFQLKNLFSGITTAFVASFFAIFAAILVTILEKFLLHWRYAQVSALQHYMDDLFRSGIEPEYLAHLVHQDQQGLQQLQTEIRRLSASITAQSHPGSHPLARAAGLQPLEPFAPLPGGEQRSDADAIQSVLSKFLQEFSQSLHKTIDSSGRRREDGRALEIQLLSVGERLDVVMGELAHAVVSARAEMAGNHLATQELLQRQLTLLEKTDAHFAQISGQLRHADVTMGEFVTAIVRTKAELVNSHATTQDLLYRQLAYMEKLSHLDKLEPLHKLGQLDGFMEQLSGILQPLSKLGQLDGFMEQLSGILQPLSKLGQLDGLAEQLDNHLQRMRTEQAGSGEGLATLLSNALEGQSAAIRAWGDSIQELSGKWPSEEETARRSKEILDAQGLAFQQWTKSLDGLFQKLPSREEFIRLVQTERQQQTDALRLLQNSLERGFQQIPDKGDSASLLAELRTWRSSLEEGLAQHFQESGDRVVQHFSRMEQAILQWEQGFQQLPDKGDSALLLAELRAWRSSLEEGLARQLQGGSSQLVQQLSQLEQAILQQQIQVENRLQGLLVALPETARLNERQATQTVQQLQGELRQLQEQFQGNNAALTLHVVDQLKAFSTQNEQKTTRLVQALADRLSKEWNAALQAQGQTESGQEVAEKVAGLLSERIEHSFGTLSSGLVELRERFSAERRALVTAMEGWRADSSRSDQETDQKIEQKISEVISHVSTHHTHLAKVIDGLNQNLSQDLDGMRDGLLNKSEESTQQMLQKVADLGQVLEQVINTVGQEQTVFIEMLGERLEALRRRLRTK